ncbi:uncharacterized protein si:ch211-168f7.5 isoform X2 [Lampris incognitus]|nr:uncharacterized protein si:ch211-168f7.5 isoform X2 [Lampris incognitus]
MVPPPQSSPLDCGSHPGDGPAHSRTGRDGNSRWSTLSWDASSDLLSPPTPDPSVMAQLDSDSRPSSGFYSVSGSSLSDSCYSVSSETAQGGPGPPARPLRLWEQGPLCSDHSDTQWLEATGQQQQQQQPAVKFSEEVPDMTGKRSVSVPGNLEATGLSFLSDLCSGLGDPQPSVLLSLFDPNSSSCTSSLHPKSQLDPRYCTDLVSRRTKEVYSYPSPLHAVALQSPIFTSHNHEPSASVSPEGTQADESSASTSVPIPFLQPHQASAPVSVTQLEQYISRLAHQYRNRVSSSTSDLTPATTPGPLAHKSLCTPGKSHGSTQSLSAFESRSTPSTLAGSSVTPCKSLLGNSARVNLSSIGKKASRNSINLGNLPSATGEDLNISLHLNLNLNLAPGLNTSLGLEDKSTTGSCGALRTESTAASSVSSTSLSSSTPTPALRARPRISTCPSNLNHRSSLEVTSASATSSRATGFCRSLDWSSGPPPGAGRAVFGPKAGSAPESQRSSVIQDPGSSPKLTEDSPVVEEISRLSGLSRAVVVGLMEQGVELDVDCFRADTADEGTGEHRQPDAIGGVVINTEQSCDYSRVPLRSASIETDLNPQRPVQLSLNVTHSPQSHSGVTPPLSHSPQSQSSLTPPLSHSSSPIHPYQSVQTPAPHHYSSSSSHCYYQQSSSPSDLPSSTASSPSSRPHPRGRSPPRPLQPSPLGPTPLSVFRRDAPSQCSLPRVGTGGPPTEHGGVRPRGGSLRHSGGGGGGSAGGWRRAEGGEGLYRGKHTSRELIRASTVSSFTKRASYGSNWGEEEEEEEEEGEAGKTLASTPRMPSGKLWRGFEGRLWGKDGEGEREEMDRAEYGYGWRRNSSGSWRKDDRRVKVASRIKDKRPKVESSPSFSRTKGKGGCEKRSSSLRLSRRALFRSESQGLLEPRAQREEPMRGGHWVSSLDVGRGSLELSVGGGGRALRGQGEDKRLSSTASLFNLSRSQSLEGSCPSLSPLSSPSFSPSPPPRMPLQRSRSLRDLGRRMFGSMRSLSLRRKTSKK